MYAVEVVEVVVAMAVVVSVETIVVRAVPREAVVYDRLDGGCGHNEEVVA